MTTDQRIRQHGSVVFEAALVMPLILFIALLIIDFGGALRAHQILNNAAREGAHIASLRTCNNPRDNPSSPDPTCSAYPEITAAVQAYLCANGVGVKDRTSCTPTGVPITIVVDQSQTIPGPDPIDPNETQTAIVTVTMSYPMTLLSAISPGTPSVSLQGRAQFVIIAF